jgi:hypothetical protein
MFHHRFRVSLCLQVLLDDKLNLLVGESTTFVYKAPRQSL